MPSARNTVAIAVGAIALTLLALWLGLKFGGISRATAVPALIPQAAETQKAVPPASPSTPLAASRPSGLHFAAGPADGRDIAIQAAQRFAGRNGPLGVLDVRPPLPTFTMQERAPGGLASATTAGTTYLVTSNGTLVSSVVVTSDPQTGANHAGQIGMTPNPDLLNALDALAADPRVLAGSFEPRLLNIITRAGNRYSVLWLKSDAQNADLLYAVRTYFQSPIETGKLYEPDEFLKLLGEKR